MIVSAFPLSRPGVTLCRRLVLACLLTIAGFAARPAAAAGFQSSRVLGSVVYVAISDGKKVVGNGSGFIVAPGIVVTNAHVANAGARFYIVRNGDDGSHAIEATVVLKSQQNDLAILRAPGLAGRALAVSAGEPALGVPVWALGFPGLADSASAEDRALVSLTTGTVSRVIKGRTKTGGSDTTRLVQHTALFAPGSSGGPLVDACYRVVGINTELSSSEGSTYLFSIASSVLPALLRQAGVAASVSTSACGDSPAAGAPADGPAAPTADVPEARADDIVRPQRDPVASPDNDEMIDSREDEIDRAKARAAQARRRAAAARAAAIAARARNDKAEADRQQAIADKDARLADEMDRYSRSLQDQLDAIKRDPIERYLPIGIAVAALAALVGLIVIGRRRYAAAQRRRDAQARMLREREAEAEARTGRDVALIGPDGSLKLPGSGLQRGLVVGRSPERADVVLPKEAVGRAHARFQLVDDMHSGIHAATHDLVVTDLGSANGTFVNGRRLEPNGQATLRDGDQIAFSKLHAFKVQFQ